MTYNAPSGSNLVSQYWDNQPYPSGSPTPLPVAASQNVTGTNAALAFTGVISGTVHDGQGNPVVNASVYASSPSGSGSATTAADGSYAITGLSPDTDYTVQFVSPVGSTLDGQYFFGQANPATFTAVSVTAGHTTAGIDATLAPSPGSISGTVTDHLDFPSGGVEVNAYDGSGHFYSTATASDGTYQLAGVAVGSYTVVFEPAASSGFGHQWFNGQDSLASATKAIVTPGQNLLGINASLGLGGTISGEATDTSGASAAGVYVAIYRTGESDQAGHAVTASDGSYQSTGLAPGTYTVEFEPPAASGLAYQWWNGQAITGTPATVTVTASFDTSAISAVLQTGGTITGTAVEASGAPLAGVTGNLFTLPGEVFAGRVTSAADGTFSSNGLSAGSYELELVPPDGSGLDGHTVSPVVVTAGTATDVGTVTMSAVPGTVTGTVTDAASKAGLGDVCVYLYAPGGANASYGTCSQADGSFGFGSVAPGTYIVAYADTSAGHYTDWLGGASSAGTSSLLVVSPGATVDASQSMAAITAPPVNALTGVVTDSMTGQPLANVCAYLWDGVAMLRSSCTDAGGAYSFTDIAPGTYTVEFIDESGSHTTQWSADAATQTNATAVTVTSSSQLTANATMARLPGTVAGTVTDPTTGKPLANICEYLYSPGATGTYAGSATCTNSAGNYVLSGVSAGNYVVAFVDPNGYFQTTWSGGVGVEANATMFTMPAAGQSAGVDVTMGMVPQSVGGIISDATTGLPLANVCVYVYPWSGTSIGAQSSYATCSNASGRYLVQVGVAGSYELAFVDPTGAHPTEWSAGTAGVLSTTPIPGGGLMAGPGDPSQRVDAALTAG